MNSTIIQTSDKETLGNMFDEADVFHKLKHFLPTQTSLKDFIHHNSLHAFQEMKFFDAIYKASAIFGYQVTLQLTEFRELYKTGRIKDNVLERVIADKFGVNHVTEWKRNMLDKSYNAENFPRIGLLRNYWKSNYQTDLDNLVQPLLFRVLCSYLDQGISIWKFPMNEAGFLASLREMEKNSYASFFKSSRARDLLLSDKCDLPQLLKIVVGDVAYYEEYLFDQQFSHRGWSGMAATVEAFPNSLHDKKVISLRDMIIFELLLEIDALDTGLGKGWAPLSSVVSCKPQDLFSDIAKSELNDVFTLWQHAFEWSYYDEVLAGMAAAGKKGTDVSPVKSFQALFCIDERECSLRRHIEHVDPSCETLGTPGFFGVEFYFKPENALFYDKLCPAPVTPKYLVKEEHVKEKRKHELLYTPLTHSFIPGFFLSMTFGFWAGLKLFLNVFRPKMSPAISNAFTHMTKHSQLIIENKAPDDKENGLQIGFTVEEMAARVEGQLRSIGLVKNFSPIIYAIAHGSSSANNPHHGAHDCGACSGRPGSVNSRVFSFMANHPKVRELLRTRGIDIPEQTRFVGALHDTAADQIEYYDEDLLTADAAKMHLVNKEAFENALDLNAKERSRRFSSIDTKAGIKKVRKAILDRSVSMFEPRPELGHGTNTLCIIGSRNMTKGLFLDRRAFMNSYDHKTDPDGKLLTGVMKPIGPVCGGINLEYYFSRVDNYKLGAGTKLPHHVMGLIGVANSSDGDLRPGLPLQMIEVHDPVRLLVIVEHFPEVVLKVIQSAPEMYEWYINEWVHLMVVHPETRQYHYFSSGSFGPYSPLSKSIGRIEDMNALIESAKEMETNYIVDATKENLPVYTLN